MIVLVERIDDLGTIRISTKDRRFNVLTQNSLPLLSKMGRRRRVFYYAEEINPIVADADRPLELQMGIRLLGEPPRSLGWGYRKNQRKLPPPRRQFR